MDHDRGVPADVGPDPSFDVLIAREVRLPLGRDRVDVVRTAQCRHADLPLPGALEQPEQDVARALSPGATDDGVEGFQPFTRLIGIEVGQLAGQAIGDDRCAGPGRRAVKVGIPAMCSRHDSIVVPTGF